ncbi:conserved hypothetical protein [Talaromyces marneffei ATCC 18224]|uniref:Letm1 RBD domain-containing protein n=1 Tax=Talaromyces marneffei (strain ATCC 18224 / CBS 334.59 / QM 7333) TaxID=441960 RepID=B6QTL3_TALMQ|nr:conserved hypothetical protein [Talaromyces marneffei ATCC 18224]
MAPASTSTPSLARASIYRPYILEYPSIGYTSRRHASSRRDKRATPSTATTTPPSPKSFLGESKFAIEQNVNPPLSTLPIDLDLPPVSMSKESFSERSWRRLKTAGKYLVFYRDGLKNTYRNWKASIPIRRQLGLPLYIPSSPPSSARNPSSGATSLYAAIETLKITRSDFQLVRRAAYDIRRLIPFGLIFLICGEFTPLVVVLLGDAVTPYTCRIPKQLAKTRAKRLEQKGHAFAAVQGGLGSMKPMREQDVMTWQALQFGSREFAATASAEQVLRACAVFGLAKSHDQGAAWVSLIYRPRLQKWTEYLALDDQLIVQNGGVDYLSAQELKIAIDERGGFEPSADVRRAGQVEKAEREWLKLWLKTRKFIE